MCGFVGYTGICEDNQNVLRRMLAKIAHRGPDSEDVYFDEHISIGFRRLSIIEQSQFVWLSFTGFSISLLHTTHSFVCFILLSNHVGLGDSTYPPDRNNNVYCEL